MADVYLIHLDQPLKHARHYLGFTSLDTVSQRLERHKNGSGARLLLACNHAGVNYQIVRTWTFETWQEARAFERLMKSRKNAPRYCPVCNQKISNVQLALQECATSEI